ncbi:MAG: nuclear transport factor 2 family protein [Trebonia sp.]
MADQQHTPPFPPQAWAHRQGKVAMKRLVPADWSPAALAARAQIAEAFYRFGVAHDECQVAAMGSCFTGDAVWEVARGTAQAFTRFEGRPGIEARLTRILDEMNDQRRHLVSNVLVEELDLDAGTAAALAYGIVSVAADGLQLGASVIYSAQLRREADGCWRFCYFYIGMDDFAGPRPTSGEP